MQAAKHRVEEEEEEKEGGVKETNNYTVSSFNCKNHTLAFSAQNVLSRGNNEEISDPTLSHQQVGQTACRRRP